MLLDEIIRKKLGWRFRFQESVLHNSIEHCCDFRSCNRILRGKSAIWITFNDLSCRKTFDCFAVWNGNVIGI